MWQNEERLEKKKERGVEKKSKSQLKKGEQMGIRLLDVRKYCSQGSFFFFLCVCSKLPL